MIRPESGPIPERVQRILDDAPFTQLFLGFKEGDIEAAFRSISEEMQTVAPQWQSTVAHSLTSTLEYMRLFTNSSNTPQRFRAVCGLICIGYETGEGNCFMFVYDILNLLQQQRILNNNPDDPERKRYLGMIVGLLETGAELRLEHDDPLSRTRINPAF